MLKLFSNPKTQAALAATLLSQLPATAAFPIIPDGNDSDSLATWIALGTLLILSIGCTIASLTCCH